MAGWNYLVILVVAALLVGAWFLVRKYANRQLSFFLKVAALTLFVIFMFRYLLRDEAFNGTVKFVTKTYLFPNRFLSFMALLTNWLFLGNILILTFYPYFTKVRYAVWLARTYSVLSTALTLLCLPLLLTAINGAGAWHDVNLLTILIDIELGFAICLTANAFLTPAPKLNVKDIGLFGLAVFAILVATMPAYAPQYVIGYINPMVKIEGFSFWHRIYLYSAFVLPFLVYLGLRGRSRETIKSAHRQDQ